MGAPTEVTSGAIVRWCATATSSLALGEGVLDRLQRTIGFDGAFFATADPATLLYTSAVRRDMPADASPAFIRTEFGEHDVNQFRILARAPTPVGDLDAATKGDRMSSLRYREAMRPFGLGDELRVALRVDGLCWGLLCLHRLDGVAGFGQRDAALLKSVAPHLAEGLRRSVAERRAIEDWTDGGPGVAVLDRDRNVQATTPAAAMWLEELAELDVPRAAQLPTVVRTVIERLDAGGPRGDTTLLPRVRVRAPSGRWLVIHASQLDSGRGVAVVIEPATPAVLSSLVIAAYGLTARETDVAQRLLAGLARKTIASELCISQYTVNDHVKAVFDKTGVSSAGQLRAQVFADQSAPPR